MKDCINYECKQHEEGICPNDCKDIILATHTPNYAEEQLEHAKEKERLINELNQEGITNIDYEEEYNKLKEDINILETNFRIEREDNEILSTQNGKEIESLKQLLFEKGAENSKLREEINNLNNIIERKDKELDGERKGNTFLENENKKLLERVERVNKSNEELKAKIAELGERKDNKRLEDERNWYKELSESRGDNNKKYEAENNILKEQLENELNRNRILKEKLETPAITKEDYELLQKKNKTIESDLIKYESIIKNQKEAIKTLATLL